MPHDNFLRRKKNILAKKDKSSKQSRDKKILDLCDKINSLENFYTTSSCAGRIVLMIDKNKKEEGLFVKVYHELISLKELKDELEKIRENKIIKFKQEPPIFHVACRNLNYANEFLKKAKFAGWKRAGIISINKNRIVLELMSTEKLELPIVENKKILVDDCFLKLLVGKSNENLKKGWEKIEKLKSSI